jgi:hypothetical protein
LEELSGERKKNHQTAIIDVTSSSFFIETQREREREREGAREREKERSLKIVGF